MAILYYFANLYHLLVIGTTNKSEMEIGYFTKYGDGGVDIEPIADLYKTEIIELAKRLKLPSQIIETIPTADLWPGQTDEKEIGISYQKLDTILKLLTQGFKGKEISLLVNLPRDKIKDIIERRKKNLHKLLSPPICKCKF
jgi:NAD+ synthase